MANIFKQMANEQRARIFKKLAETEPGTQEYRELQSQLGAYDIMDEKQRCGKVTQADWFKFSTTAAITLAVLSADQWMPMVAGKLRIIEFGSKFLK